MGLKRQSGKHGALEDAWLAMNVFFMLKGTGLVLDFSVLTEDQRRLQNLQEVPPIPEGDLPPRKRAPRVKAKQAGSPGSELTGAPHLAFEMRSDAASNRCPLSQESEGHAFTRANKSRVRRTFPLCRRPECRRSRNDRISPLARVPHISPLRCGSFLRLPPPPRYTRCVAPTSPSHPPDLAA